jgi:hypothetical protein
LPSTATRSRPIHTRRYSGPARRPLPAGPPVRGRTSAFEKIARLPDYRVVDRVLRSRGSILLIGVMLGGIVAMQVSLLKLNTGISNGVRTQETLAGQNATLQMQIAERSSAAAVREKAATMGLVDPPAGDTRFLTSRGADKDAKRAVKRIKPPSDQARMVMYNEGFMPGPGATVASLLAAQETTATTTATAPQPTTTPVETPAPLPTPVATVDPATGVAPQG